MPPTSINTCLDHPNHHTIQQTSKHIVIYSSKLRRKEKQRYERERGCDREGRRGGDIHARDERSTPAMGRLAWAKTSSPVGRMGQGGGRGGDGDGGRGDRTNERGDGA